MTLAGSIDQVIDVSQAASLFGASTLAGATLTLSVEDPSSPLAVTIGSRSATVPAGSGRVSITVTLDGAETGNITVRLQSSGGGSFRHVKLELGAYASPWAGETPEMDEIRCRRYYQRLAASGGAPSILGYPGQRVGTNAIDFLCPLPVPMRADPLLLTSAFVWSGSSPNSNQIAFYNNSSGAWTSLLGGLSIATVAPPSPSCAVMRLQAATSFSGTAGNTGSLYMGNIAYIALQAEL